MKLINKKLLLVVGVVVAFIILAVLMLFLSSLKKPVQKAGRTGVVGIVPSETQILTPNVIQKFQVVFGAVASASNAKFELSYQPFGNQETKKVKIKTLIDERTATIVNEDPTIPNSKYTLTIAQSGEKEVVAKYLSGSITPTPISVNNESLTQFLPYKTQTFILEYNEARNIYIMHFLYSAASSVDLNTQFDSAKKQANDFIASKNIPLSSIKIEYLYK